MASAVERLYGERNRFPVRGRTRAYRSTAKRVFPSARAISSGPTSGGGVSPASAHEEAVRTAARASNSGIVRDDLIGISDSFDSVGEHRKPRPAIGLRR